MDFNVEDDHFKENKKDEDKFKVNLDLHNYWKPILLPELVEKIEKNLDNKVYTKKVGANEGLKPENFG